MPGLGAAPLPVGLMNWQPVGAGVGAKGDAVGIPIITGGALVTTGLLPAPAGDQREPTIREIEERAAEVGSVGSLISAAGSRKRQAIRATSVPPGHGEEARLSLLKANKQGNLRLAAAKRTRPAEKRDTGGNGSLSQP